jgi:hypothetical protein
MKRAEQGAQRDRARADAVAVGLDGCDEAADHRLTILGRDQPGVEGDRV